MSRASGAGMELGGGFVHLHLHSEYSLLDGGNRIDKLAARVAELGMSAVAITDHGNLFGAVAFDQACRERGIKPILGVEAYVTPHPGKRTERVSTGAYDGGFHLVLLAESLEGWRNLLELCSEAFLTGFYHKPRLDRDLLEKHSAGLIAINGHLGSELGEHLLQFERSREAQCWERAVEAAQWHRRVFAPTGAGPRFYVELQHHVKEQNEINPHLIRLAKELDLPLVATNDAHFLRAEDHDAHDTLICISINKAKSEQERLRYPAEIYVKSPAEMREAFAPYGEVGVEACDNTIRIARRVDFELPIGGQHAPMVRVGIQPEDRLPRHDDPVFAGDPTAWYGAYCAGFEVRPFDGAGASEAELAAARAECDQALRLLARAGMRWRYGEAAPEVEARLERELDILCAKGISAYFLIVWDFVNWGRQRAIPALARGSGVGTMVGYVLGLSNACPVRYGLLFERFTDPDRAEYPDIDIDLCQDGRARVIEYVRRKYGHVAQIITFGTLKARAALRDVGRVLEMPLAEVDRIAKLVPEVLGTTLDDALQAEPEFRALYERDEKVRRVVDTARTFEGQARHASVHAAGVIVAARRLQDIVPLYKQTGAPETEIVTQWDGPTCEKMGLLKMDFLGLRTISTVERCKRLIREGLAEAEIWRAVGRAVNDGGPHPLDLDRLTFDDQRVFELFRRAETTGVFQFESPGMKRLLIEMKPDRLEDLIAANALFRPGPMDLIPDYNRRKHGLDPVPRIHPIVDRYTAETYGVMVYQEQVMQVVHALGGIPLREAYALIKAISKKKEKIIEAARPRFVEGAQRQGLARDKAGELFEMILKFAGYGFNKSHSTGYAIVAYQTAYLKAFFPAQYLAAFLTFESASSQVAEWTPYLEDCRKARIIDPVSARTIRTGVEVRPPDVNLSLADFAVVHAEGEPRRADTGHIRFGLAAIKGAGERGVAAIITERDSEGRREFTSLHDFCERVMARGQGLINRATLESLIKAGAFDSLHGRENRSAMLATLEQAMQAGQRAAADRAAGQGGLFGGGAGGAAPRVAATLARAAPWSEAETLAKEKEALGFYVSSHPLDRWKFWIDAFADCDAARARELAHETRAVLAGLVQSVRPLVVRRGEQAGQKMAVARIEDLTGTIEVVLFTDAFARYGHLLVPEAALFVLGRADTSRGAVQIIADKLVPIDGVPLQPGKLRVVVDEMRLNGGTEPALERLAELAGVRPSAAGAGAPGPSAAAWPLQIVVVADECAVLLEADARFRMALDPARMKALEALLGPGAARVVEGVSVEAEPRRRWPRRANASDD